MMKRFWGWVGHPAYPWQFWYPQSGPIGGIIGGTILGFLIFATWYLKY